MTHAMPKGHVDRWFRASYKLSTAMDQLQVAVHALRGSVGYLHLGVREVRAKVADAEAEIEQAKALLNKMEEQS